ncbi:MAG: hypothetical protein ACFFDK_02625 [Promethearchaeota archaeon]
MAVSIYGLVGTFSIVFVFGIYFIITLKSYIQSKNISSLFFSISFFATTITYLVWGLRVILISQYERNITVLLPYWRAAYLFASLSLIFLDLASLKLAEISNKSLLILLYLLIIVTYIVMATILFLGFEVEITIFMDVSDLRIVNSLVYIYFLILLLFYLALPNSIFFNYLRKGLSKTTFAYKKVQIIEIGLLLFTIGTILDGARFPSNIGILIARIIIMIGGLFMMRGFTMKIKMRDEDNI